ncbi:MAG: spore coat protein CotJB [Eubacteriales bacterium]|nr:spore coat protein CotJB [Eubacteriales bacterium]
MDSQKELLNKIRILEFVLHDTGLYLDTHPLDQEALRYYRTNREMLDAAIDEYTSYYGPLTMDAVLSKNKWTWIEKPWPWEVEA